MFIEDLLELATGTGKYLFRSPPIVSGNDLNILESISNQTAFHRSGLTEKQSQLVIKLLKKNQDIIRVHAPSIDTDLANPQWRNTFRTIPTVKRISIGRLEGTTDRILVEFPYNQELVDLFRQRNQELHELHKGVWDTGSKKWVFFLTEKTVEWLGDLLLPREFQADEKFQTFYDSIKSVLKEIEACLPMLTQTDAGFEIKNVRSKIPQLQTGDLVEALFWARDHGITNWDDHIETRINTEVHPVTKSIISATNKNYPWFDSVIHKLDVFRDLIRYGGPAIVIIPGGSELELIQSWNEFAGREGITAEQISVMFRLPNEQADFNHYVKTAGLNNPISENTRLVFVSTKITKPLVKSGVKFNTVINLGYYNYMHFTMSTVVDNAQNLVYYSMKAPTKNNNRWQPREL